MILDESRAKPADVLVTHTGQLLTTPPTVSNFYSNEYTTKNKSSAINLDQL